METKRPHPKATRFAFNLSLDKSGPNEFVLSELFPQAFGKKRRKVDPAPKESEAKKEEEDDEDSSPEDEAGEVDLGAGDDAAPGGAAAANAAAAPRGGRYNVVERLERFFGGGELATGLGGDSDDEGGLEYYESDDSFIDDSEVFESAETRDTAARTRPTEYAGFFASSSAKLATVEAPAPKEKAPKKRKKKSSEPAAPGAAPKKKAKAGPTAAQVSKLIADDAKLTVAFANPKRGESAARYERYKSATSAKGLLALGASRADFKNDIAKGYVTLAVPLPPAAPPAPTPAAKPPAPPPPAAKSPSPPAVAPAAHVLNVTGAPAARVLNVTGPAPPPAAAAARNPSPPKTVML